MPGWRWPGKVTVYELNSIWEGHLLREANTDIRVGANYRMQVAVDWLRSVTWTHTRVEARGWHEACQEVPNDCRLHRLHTERWPAALGLAYASCSVGLVWLSIVHVSSQLTLCHLAVKISLTVYEKRSLAQQLRVLVHYHISNACVKQLLHELSVSGTRTPNHRSWVSLKSSGKLLASS